MNIYRTFLLIFVAITVIRAVPVTQTNQLSNAEAVESSSATTRTLDGSSEEQAGSNDQSAWSSLSTEWDSDLHLTDARLLTAVTAVTSEEKLMTDGLISADHTAKTQVSNGLEITELSTDWVTNKPTSYSSLPFSQRTGGYVEHAVSTEVTPFKTDVSDVYTRVTGLSTTEISGKINHPVTLVSELSPSKLLDSETSHLSVGYDTVIPVEEASASSRHDITLPGAPVLPNAATALTPIESAQPTNSQLDRASASSLDIAVNARETNVAEGQPHGAVDDHVRASTKCTTLPANLLFSEPSDIPIADDTRSESDTVKSSGSHEPALGSVSVSNEEPHLLASPIDLAEGVSHKFSGPLEDSQVRTSHRKALDYSQENKKKDSLAGSDIDAESQIEPDNKHSKEDHARHHGNEGENGHKERVHTKKLVHNHDAKEHDEIHKAMDDENDEEVGSEQRDDSDYED
ncbi:unnamed protein product [Dicrocoelium dendriticum]|nr:unnamed protein product [Dicrocoelium dendriticum]